MENVRHADEAPALVFTISNTLPVELSDLSQALFALADEYKRHAAGLGEGAPDDVKLYVKEIREGSIVAELVALVPLAASAAPFLADANTVISFAKHLRAGFDWLRTRVGSPPASTNKRSLQNLSKIVEPVAKDSGAQINIGTIRSGATVQITMNSIEASAVQNQAGRQLQRLREPTSGLHENVVMYWYQARNDASANVGDKAIIERLSRNPVKTVFANEELKRLALGGEGDKNPLRYPFQVDVKVETVRDKPVLYNIVAVHGQLDLAPDGEPELLSPPQLDDDADGGEPEGLT